MTDKRLLEEPFFHGLLPREDLKALLRLNGDFLVRSTEPVPGQPRAFVLSVMVQQEKEDQGIKHYVIQHINNKYMVERWSFDSISEMISHHLQRNESISKSKEQPVFLRTPITRQKWELTHEEVEVTKKLGEGAFGEVSLGKLTRKGTITHTVDVAIKLAKLETLTKEQIKEIMHEARLMRNFDHPNVIKMYGIAALQEPLMIVMELATDGALDSFLKKFFVPPKRKTEMCAGAAFGLGYLHNVCNVIHCDIAARNCLLSHGQVKISDFGLTREGTIYQMESGKRVPIRWLAPETLRTASYSQKSDVYSYGILVWEIFSNGAEPYPGMAVSEVHAKVKERYRMPFPEGTPLEVVDMIMQRSWPDSPNERWSMAEICKFWEQTFNIRCQSHRPSNRPSFNSTLTNVAQQNVVLGNVKEKQSNRAKKKAITPQVINKYNKKNATL